MKTDPASTKPAAAKKSQRKTKAAPAAATDSMRMTRSRDPATAKAAAEKPLAVRKAPMKREAEKPEVKMAKPKAAAPPPKRKAAAPAKKTTSKKAHEKEPDDDGLEAAPAAEAPRKRGRSSKVEAVAVDAEQPAVKEASKAKPAAARRGRGSNQAAAEEAAPTEEESKEEGEEPKAKRARGSVAAKKAPEKPKGVKGKEADAEPQPADLFVFGSNPFGALGLGEEETVKYRPAQVAADVGKFVQVACGGMHTVALAEDGKVGKNLVNTVTSIMLPSCPGVDVGCERRGCSGPQDRGHVLGGHPG